MQESGEHHDLQEILRRRVDAAPHAVLLERGTERWTNAEFAGICGQLARRLQCLPGVGNVIGVSAESSRFLPFLLWASILARLDLLLLPAFRRPEMLEAAVEPLGLRAVFSDAENMVLRSGFIRLDRIMEFAASDPGDPGVALPDATVTPAFVFQTSGTEGAPKSVRCEHWKFARVIEAMLGDGALAHARECRAFISQPLVHSYGLCAFLEYCAAEATVVLPPENSALGPVGDLMNAERFRSIEAIEGVPYFWSQFAKLRSKIRLPALRHLGLGGGRLDPAIMRNIVDQHPGATISVRYGLTETPSVATHKVYRPPHRPEQDWISSGRVISAYEVEIRGENGQLVVAGSEGEIFVLGTCVSDPSGELRTGDLGYFDDAGELIVTGRRSAFIKRRGYRLSPEMIEAAASQCEGIRDCRAVGRGEQLILEVVLARPRSDVELLAALRQRLSDTMVPDLLVRVEQIPRTYSGKIKRS